MKIIVEGPDGSGKSTLVHSLATNFDLAIIPGSGPEKYPGEMSERAIQWIKLLDDPRGLVFDRHPCFSHPIYSQFTPVSKIPKIILSEFYSRLSQFKLIICTGHRVLTQVRKHYDTDEHVRSIEENHRSICTQYDSLGRMFADCIYDYRIHTMDDVVNRLEIKP